MLSRESLRVFLAGLRSPCREVGSGTDKFNDDQRFTTGEHDLQPGGEFHGKDNAANAVTATKMQRSRVSSGRSLEFTVEIAPNFLELGEE